ncbi:hypothetical protein KUCAC02_024838 [Chaenocephalus aceratus]|nr:hypothetical protein KUCAC02_024838 [Chaenocephalus aceratus]
MEVLLLLSQSESLLSSYMRILRVCFSGSKQTRQKALSTCTPHLASLINFSFGGCFEALQSGFDMRATKHSKHVLRYKLEAGGSDD